MPRYSLVPVVVAFAALFSLLPQTGADATSSIVGARGQWRFTPAVVRIDQGDRIAFRNDTRSTHTATCTQPACWDSGDIQPGETVFMTFEDEGSFGYRCQYHPTVASLAGRVIVGDVEQTDPTPSPSPTGSGPSTG